MVTVPQGKQNPAYSPPRPTFSGIWRLMIRPMVRAGFARRNMPRGARGRRGASCTRTSSGFSNGKQTGGTDN